MVLRNLEVIEYPGDEVELVDAVASLSNAAHLITTDAELNLVNQYWLKIAPPNELADYIVKQPNHTWNGITIYPGEAWRDSCNPPRAGCAQSCSTATDMKPGRWADFRPIVVTKSPRVMTGYRRCVHLS